MADTSGSADEVTSPVPGTVRAAGVLVGAEGVVGVVMAVLLLLDAAFGENQSFALATSLGFFVLGGGVAVTGGALVLGCHWARALAFVSQLLLVPVVWSMLTDSHQPLYGAVLGTAVIGSLVLLLLPPSTRWASEGP